MPEKVTLKKNSVSCAFYSSHIQITLPIVIRKKGLFTPLDKPAKFQLRYLHFAQKGIFIAE